MKTVIVFGPLSFGLVCRAAEPATKEIFFVPMGLEIKTPKTPWITTSNRPGDTDPDRLSITFSRDDPKKLFTIRTDRLNSEALNETSEEKQSAVQFDMVNTPVHGMICHPGTRKPSRSWDTSADG